MTGRRIELEIAPGERILLDTTVLVSYLNGNEPASPIATLILDEFVLSGRNEAVVSMVTILEVLVRPLRQDVEVSRQVLDFLQNFPNVRNFEVNFAVAQEAAQLRARYNIATPDALIVATGLTAGVTKLITNDISWPSKLRSLSERIDVCLLGDLAK